MYISISMDIYTYDPHVFIYIYLHIYTYSCSIQMQKCYSHTKGIGQLGLVALQSPFLSEADECQGLSSTSRICSRLGRPYGIVVVVGEPAWTTWVL